jgi:F-type H+-transporting ATPase subunit delta
MKGNKIAVRYAKALLDIAQEQQKIDEVAADMDYLKKVNKETLDFQILLKSPVVNSQKKIEIFNSLFGSFSNVSLMFIELITKNRREGLLAEIADAFEDQLNVLRGIVPVKIISACKLDDGLRKEIIKKIEANVNGTPKIVEEVNPEIIGGFIIKIDDKQFDASISRQLNNLKQRLTK